MLDKIRLMQFPGVLLQHTGKLSMHS